MQILPPEIRLSLYKRPISLAPQRQSVFQKSQIPGDSLHFGAKQAARKPKPWAVGLGLLLGMAMTGRSAAQEPPKDNPQKITQPALVMTPEDITAEVNNTVNFLNTDFKKNHSIPKVMGMLKGLDSMQVAGSYLANPYNTTQSDYDELLKGLLVANKGQDPKIDQEVLKRWMDIVVCREVSEPTLETGEPFETRCTALSNIVETFGKPAKPGGPKVFPLTPDQRMQILTLNDAVVTRLFAEMPDEARTLLRDGLKRYPALWRLDDEKYSKEPSVSIGQYQGREVLVSPSEYLGKLATLATALADAHETQLLQSPETAADLSALMDTSVRTMYDEVRQGRGINREAERFLSFTAPLARMTQGAEFGDATQPALAWNDAAVKPMLGLLGEDNLNVENRQALVSVVTRVAEAQRHPQVAKALIELMQAQPTLANWKGYGLATTQVIERLGNPKRDLPPLVEGLKSAFSDAFAHPPAATEKPDAEACLKYAAAAEVMTALSRAEGHSYELAHTWQTPALIQLRTDMETASPEEYARKFSQLDDSYLRFYTEYTVSQNHELRVAAQPDLRSLIKRAFELAKSGTPSQQKNAVHTVINIIRLHPRDEKGGVEITNILDAKENLKTLSGHLQGHLTQPEAQMAIAILNQMMKRAKDSEKPEHAQDAMDALVLVAHGLEQRVDANHPATDTAERQIYLSTLQTLWKTLMAPSMFHRPVTTQFVKKTLAPLFNRYVEHLDRTHLPLTESTALSETIGRCFEAAPEVAEAFIKWAKPKLPQASLAERTACYQSLREFNTAEAMAILETAFDTESAQAKAAQDGPLHPIETASKALLTACLRDYLEAPDEAREAYLHALRVGNSRLEDKAALKLSPAMLLSLRLTSPPGMQGGSIAGPMQPIPFHNRILWLKTFSGMALAIARQEALFNGGNHHDAGVNASFSQTVRKQLDLYEEWNPRGRENDSPKETEGQMSDVVFRYGVDKWRIAAQDIAERQLTGLLLNPLQWPVAAPQAGNKSGFSPELQTDIAHLALAVADIDNSKGRKPRTLVYNDGDNASLIHQLRAIDAIVDSKLLVNPLAYVYLPQVARTQLTERVNPDVQRVQVVALLQGLGYTRDDLDIEIKRLQHKAARLPKLLKALAEEKIGLEHPPVGLLIQEEKLRQVPEDLERLVAMKKLLGDTPLVPVPGPRPKVLDPEVNYTRMLAQLQDFVRFHPGHVQRIADKSKSIQRVNGWHEKEILAEAQALAKAGADLKKRPDKKSKDYIAEREAFALQVNAFTARKQQQADAFKKAQEDLSEERLAFYDPYLEMMDLFPAAHPLLESFAPDELAKQYKELGNTARMDRFDLSPALEAWTEELHLRMLELQTGKRIDDRAKVCNAMLGHITTASRKFGTEYWQARKREYASNRQDEGMIQWRKFENNEPGAK